MTAEEVVRNLQFRPGFQLVDYGEVGLPIFRLTIEAVTLAHRVLPTIHEFVMRCLALGETREDSVARMLGLSQDVVAAALSVLTSEGHVSRHPAVAEEYAFRLTEAGTARLAMESEEVPQEEMLVVDYDGIARAPLRLASENVLRASELQHEGAIQIRPYPAEPPQIQELSIADVSKVVRRRRGEDFQRSILVLKRIVRRSNLFRRAVALIFLSDDHTEIQVAFAIAGRLSATHERAFAEHAGPRKMGFVRGVAGSAHAKRFERVVGRSVATLAQASPAALMEARREEAEALAGFSSARAAVQQAGRGLRPTDPVGIAYAQADERLQMARFALEQFDVRPLACFEQIELLDAALREARTSLFVTSAGLQASTLTYPRLREIDRLAAVGVQVEVRTALRPQMEARGGDRYDPLAELTQRATRGELSLIQDNSSEFFWLIQDDELAVLSNQPFLGDISRRSGFTCVQGLVIRRHQLVDELRASAQRTPVSRRPTGRG